MESSVQKDRPSSKRAGEDLYKAKSLPSKPGVSKLFDWLDHNGL